MTDSMGQSAPDHEGTGSPVTELLTPEDVREIQRGPSQSWPNTYRLCHDYLTLWERNKELGLNVAELLAAMDTDRGEY